MTDRLVYTALRPCGCIQGRATMDSADADSRKSTARTVAMWVRDGWRLSTHVNPKPSDLPDEWDCAEHRQ